MYADVTGAAPITRNFSDSEPADNQKVLLLPSAGDRR